MAKDSRLPQAPQRSGTAPRGAPTRRPRFANAAAPSELLDGAPNGALLQRPAPRELAPRVPAPAGRVEARGKFLFAGGKKLYVRGVTYGTFRPADDGCDYPPPAVVTSDFAAMADNGINAVRTYTVPPRWLLDLAHTHGLRVMVGLPWEQHVTFLDERARRRSIEQRVRDGVRACAGHPAVLGYAVGNEIPTGIVRWYGRAGVERFLHRLYRAAKDEDPDGLVTYVNYPSTEYLDLRFLDFATFNVYLEHRESLEAYLARLHNLVGDTPLVMAEIGLDSRRHGAERQAEVLDWQVRSTFASGCAGAFLFAWTDEWHRGGYDIEDWDFGLTDRGRRPKPALRAARRAFGSVPFSRGLGWPSASVIVCTHNGARTLGECCAALTGLHYTDYEVIVVCDGCTDDSADIARRHGVRVIETENRGLASARNTGLAAAGGEIVAYIDDDAVADPDWLTYLAAAFLRTDHVGVGGPNIPPGGDGVIAESVANAPGGPTHVLTADREAEHIPGCNMAFRRDVLQAIGGFDPQFTAAGDDVDVCWRLQERGGTLGFSPAALVWHHRRNSLRAYWRQQIGYGKAEALVERKWPEKYNGIGHLRWAGRIYAKGLVQTVGRRRERIRYGTWGTGLFQSIYQPAAGTLGALPLMPEWYLLVAALAALSAIGIAWAPLMFVLPLFVAAAAALLAPCVAGALRADVPAGASWGRRVRVRLLTGFLHAVQPLARLRGRLRNGLTPWRRRTTHRLVVPRPRTTALWSETWAPPEERLRAIETDLIASGAAVARGGPCDRWDLEVRGGVFGAARLRAVTEEHGAGKQLTRLRSWPRLSVAGAGLTALFIALAVAAALDGAWPAVIALGALAVVVVGRMLEQCAAACGDLIPAHRGTPARRRARGRRRGSMRTRVPKVEQDERR